MANLTYPTFPADAYGYAQGRGDRRFSGVDSVMAGSLTNQDPRHIRPTTGSITDQVVVKAGGIDVPFENGRVWLLRLADGYKAWEGWSDAAGNYTATGLELGVKYIPVAIDPYGNQKATAAGPVVAA